MGIKDMNNEWENHIEAINQAVINKAIEEGIVKKTMDINMEDFDI